LVPQPGVDPGEGLRIHLASLNGLSVAAILTLSFKKTMVYKYGGSDARFHRLGSVPFLFWHAIQEAKAGGVDTLDLGRSSLDQSGCWRSRTTSARNVRR